ncbi:penicillin acylase family protein [Microvirga aerophila]|uniref:penicillin acylase family protein n=1 Tax=Microvirga aerophila TaxID=670291 RepID=UPI001AEE298B|nr:penicillin acylase family protein [Microvirga aerophila]
MEVSSQHPRVEAIEIEGLEAETEILIDRWGVPHIYAHTDHDIFLAQGFAVARDRLWQIDVWRKRGLGLLAADYGASYVEADRAARLLLYRGDMDAEWAAYGPGARAAAEAFSRGINAYITFLERHPGRMPVEFLRTGAQPSRWFAEDCVRIRSHGPLFNLSRELVRANVIDRFGLEAEAARRRLEPEWKLTLPEGIAAEAIPAEVGRIFALGTNQPVFGRNEVSVPDATGGSNNWAVGASRTATGRPILASDPHRLLSLPALRYVSHLSAPNLDVIGAGEPGVPGIAIGHNRTSAFCLTIHLADQADLYVYELHPNDPTLYCYGSCWERMDVISETVPVRGANERIETLFFTRHGPVLYVDNERKRAYAVRSIWSEPGAAPYLGALRYLRTTSWNDFVEARAHWRTPPVNHVYADTAGDIGWIMSGSVPVRPNWDGLLPVAGDGTYEWRGFMQADVHPRIHNPECGWVATANEMNLPPDFNHATHKVGFEWCDPSRYRVIADQLRQNSAHTLEDSQRLQTSFVSDSALRLLAMLRGLTPRDTAARRAHDLLTQWDGDLKPGSAPGLLFEIWFRKYLIEAVSEYLAPGAYAHFEPGDIAALDTFLVVDLLTKPSKRLGADYETVRDALIERTLSAAWGETCAEAGEDPATWRWGDAHHALFEHPLAELLNDTTLSTRRVAKGGSGLTPNAADYRPEDFRMIVGASFRMILDVGAWDNCIFVNAPGQSGDPRSSHYDDHLDAWGSETYLPLLFSRDKIEAATTLRLALRPTGPGGKVVGETGPDTQGTNPVEDNSRSAVFGTRVDCSS